METGLLLRMFLNACVFVVFGLFSANSASSGPFGLPSPSDLIPKPRTPIDDLEDHLSTEAHVETLGPVIAAKIRAGKADALRGTVSPLPDQVKREMVRYFPESVVNRARWRTGYGSFTVQAESISLGDKSAIVLDDIIIFSVFEDLGNLPLVAHELGHVYQYQQWGIDDFAKRYVRDYNVVEADAERMAQDWSNGAKWPSPPAPNVTAPQSRAPDKPYRDKHGRWMQVP